jgi:hypothetical protein
MILDLPDKTRPTPSARALNGWVRDAVRLTGMRERRVGWMLASTVVIAALQRALGTDGVPLFLAKGGVYLELRLGLGARATQDIDTLFRGTVDEFARTLADVMSVPWGPFTLQTSGIEVIAGARRIIQPRRLEVQLILKGAVWRKVKVEVSFPEGRIGEHAQTVPMPPVGFFGLDAPASLVAIAMDYQVAQKVHACTDPDTAGWINDRVRDVIDLELVRTHLYPQSPPPSLRSACLDIFNSRATEAIKLGEQPRPWPPLVRSNASWAEQYPDLAESVGLDLTLDEAIARAQTWIGEIDATVNDND